MRHRLAGRLVVSTCDLYSNTRATMWVFRLYAWLLRSRYFLAPRWGPRPPCPLRTPYGLNLEKPPYNTRPLQQANALHVRISKWACNIQIKQNTNAVLLRYLHSTLRRSGVNLPYGGGTYKGARNLAFWQMKKWRLITCKRLHMPIPCHRPCDLNFLHSLLTIRNANLPKTQNPRFKYLCIHMYL